MADLAVCCLRSQGADFRMMRRTAARVLNAAAGRAKAGMSKRFDQEQVIEFLREVDAAASLRALCRKHGFNDAAQALLRRTCGAMRAPQARQLRQLQQENQRLRAVLALQQQERERIRQALRQAL